MTSEMTPGHGQIPAPYPPKDHWEYNLFEYHKGLPDQSHYEFMAATPGVGTAAYWADWCQAIFYAGTTLYLWNEMPELKAAFLSVCSLEEDADIFLICKYPEESGLVPAVESVLRGRGRLTVEEIDERVITAFGTGSPSAGTDLQWDFRYLDGVPDGSIDRVILFGAASHVADWRRFAAQIERVLRNEGRLIVAEAPLGGKEFREALHEDSHYESFILRVLSGLGMAEDELPDTGAEALTAIFEPHLAWTRYYSRQGIYLFYGQKGGEGPARLVPVAKFPPATPQVREFLKVKAAETTWDLLSERERQVWGTTVADINTPHMGRCVTWGGGSLCWNYRNQREITDIMWGNLAARPGDKVMLIGEFPEDLGTLAELEKRVGPTGEIVVVNITSSPKSYDYKGWQAKRKEYMEQGSPEEWPYDFADDYPDGYFDLIFLPQGVHHCNNWLRDAPRLLRAIKPGGQVMAIECGINRPQMATARQLSALARIVGDRCFEIALPYWLVGPLSPEGPLLPGAGYEHVGRPHHDVSTAHLRESFGDGVTDACGLEYKGWILFWGYKRDLV
jgi:SAM-dependent methyltransferase